jgi:hypothetical protein
MVAEMNSRYSSFKQFVAVGVYGKYPFDDGVFVSKRDDCGKVVFIILREYPLMELKETWTVNTFSRVRMPF